eukprot:ANDGO_08400.mRNA.1 Tankyrase
MSDALLLHAVSNGDHDQVRALLAEGMASANTKSATGSTALHLAVNRSMASMVELLIPYVNDPSVSEKPECGGLTPLHAASQSGNVKIIELLCDAKAEVNIMDSLGYTPLHWAAKKGHLDAVKVLLSRGANPEIQDLMGKTAYYWAREFGHKQICELLPVFKYDVWKATETHEARFGVKKDDDDGDPKKKKDAKKKKK